MLSDEQMSNGYPFSLLNDEQMSNKVRVKHQPGRFIYNNSHPKNSHDALQVAILVFAMGCRWVSQKKFPGGEFANIVGIYGL